MKTSPSTSSAPPAPSPDTTAWALDALDPADRAAFDALLASDPDLRADAEAHRDFCRMMEKELAVAIPDEVKLDPEKLTAPAAAESGKKSSRPVLLWTAGLGLAAGLAVMFTVQHQRQSGVGSLRAPMVSQNVDNRSSGAVHAQAWEGNPDMMGYVGASSPVTANREGVKADADGPAQWAEYQRYPGHPATVDIGDVLAGSKTPGIASSDGSVGGAEASGPAEAKKPTELSGIQLTYSTSAPSQPQGSPASSMSDNTLLPDVAGLTQPSSQLTSEIATRQPGGLAKANEPGVGAGVGRGVGAGIGSGIGPTSGPVSAPAKPALTKVSENATHFAFRSKAAETDHGLTTMGDVVTEEARTAEFRSRNGLRQAPGSESYEAPPENAFLAPLQQPLSTFSIDVDTASYANVRRFLDQQTRPPLEAVRLEELINYFPYDYTPPAADSVQPFAVHVEMAGCPWSPQHRLARVAIKGKDMAADKRPASNLVFLVDVSGSMASDNKLPLVKQSLRLLMDRLTPEDRVAIVTYAGETGVALPSTSVAEKSRIISVIDALGAGGGTNGAGGIEAAYQQAVGGFIKGGVNRVILATDGDFNVGITSHDALQSLITEKAKSGVFLSVLGYGMGNLKDSTMEMLSDKGNGNYAYIDNLAEARKVLSEQASSTLVTIAKDVKIQIEFNPAVVQSYRLLGYENRLLAKEDFNNDKIDAGEIGAGHTVTALYELVPVGAQPPVPPVDGLKYQQPVSTPEPAPAVNPAAAASGETMTVKLRYKAPDGDTSQLIEVPVKDTGAAADAASAEFRWATAVCGYGLKLKNSAHAGALTWDMIRTLALGSKGADPHGYRGEFLSLIDKARGLVP